MEFPPQSKQAHQNAFNIYFYPSLFGDIEKTWPKNPHSFGKNKRPGYSPWLCVLSAKKRPILKFNDVCEICMGEREREINFVEMKNTGNIFLKLFIWLKLVQTSYVSKFPANDDHLPYLSIWWINVHVFSLSFSVFFFVSRYVYIFQSKTNENACVFSALSLSRKSACLIFDDAINKLSSHSDFGVGINIWYLIKRENYILVWRWISCHKVEYFQTSLSLCWSHKSFSFPQFNLRLWECSKTFIFLLFFIC